MRFDEFRAAHGETDPVMDRFGQGCLIPFGAAEDDIAALQVGHDIAETQRTVEGLEIGHPDGIAAVDIDSAQQGNIGFGHWHGVIIR